MSWNWRNHNRMNNVQTVVWILQCKVTLPTTVFIDVALIPCRPRAVVGRYRIAVLAANRRANSLASDAGRSITSISSMRLGLLPRRRLDCHSCQTSCSGNSSSLSAHSHSPAASLSTIISAGDGTTACRIASFATPNRISSFRSLLAAVFHNPFPGSRKAVTQPLWGSPLRTAQGLRPSSCLSRHPIPQSQPGGRFGRSCDGM